MNWFLLASLAIALVAALVLVPVVRAIARKVGMIATPDAERQLHKTPIALGGGFAVFVSLCFTFLAVLLLDRLDGVADLGYLDHRWYMLFFAAAAIMLVGLVDDRWSLRGRQKLLLQCLIVMSVAGTGTIISRLSLLGYEFQLGILSLPITMIWLLVSINALNLIDGADGMATTVGCIICAGLGFISLRNGTQLDSVVCFALAGALLGFLVYNRPPASIFLGDAGSMMIGFFVGVLAMWSNSKESTVLASAPVAVLAIPLFDSTAAIIRRWLTGRSIYMTDRGHLHHLLQARYGSLGMLVIVAALCLITTALAVMSTLYNQPLLAAVGATFVIGLLIITRSFGYAEFRLLGSRTYHFCRSFSAPAKKGETERLRRAHPMQGQGQWQNIWEPLVEFAQANELASLKIDLNMSWLQEAYHASWQSIRLPEKALQLNLCVPLFTRCTNNGSEMPIGRLQIIASATDPEAYKSVSRLIDYVEELSPQVDRIIESLGQPIVSDSGAFYWPKFDKVTSAKTNLAPVLNENGNPGNSKLQ